MIHRNQLRTRTNEDTISNLNASYNQGDLEEARFDEIMDFLTGDFHPAFWPVFSPHRYTISKKSEELKAVMEAAYGRIDIAMTHLDRLIGDSNHVYHEKRTIADAYAYVMSLWSLKTPKPYDQYPNVARFMKSMSEDSVVQAVIQKSR